MSLPTTTSPPTLPPTKALIWSPLTVVLLWNHAAGGHGDRGRNRLRDGRRLGHAVGDRRGLGHRLRGAGGRRRGRHGRVLARLRERADDGRARQGGRLLDRDRGRAGA